MPALTEEQVEDLRMRLQFFSLKKLNEQWDMVRQAAAYPPIKDEVAAEDDKKFATDFEEYTSGSLFQISQLFRDEMNFRKLKENRR